jgi:hypothetical protein
MPKYLCGPNGCRTRVRAEGLRCYQHGATLPMRMPPVVRCSAVTRLGGSCHVQVKEAGQLCTRHAEIAAQRAALGEDATIGHDRCQRPCVDGKLCWNRTGGGPCWTHRTKAERVFAWTLLPPLPRCEAERCQRRTLAGERYCYMHVRVFGVPVA